MVRTDAVHVYNPVIPIIVDNTCLNGTQGIKFICLSVLLVLQM